MDSEKIQNQKHYWRSERKRYELCEKFVDAIGDKLSDDVSFSPSYYIQITAKNRDDLTALMTLAPLWAKSFGEVQITYSATIDGERVEIIAAADALPGTCKLVEEEYEIPAQPAKEAVPAARGKKMVLKCDHAKLVETPIEALSL